ncbi:hypothetical protein K1T71_000261 [Dendrolimus kikuchii]|uniref:Uncharacterized protein n=1 Tax=Dendrolimus kikuchii TaxID=765133 RepID=A0ACC1DJJ6_9NEOP|nr:hypothetical protein K1T71_000261 [Dendrolimus kikuchii]
MLRSVNLFVLIIFSFHGVMGKGLLLLYRPRDITNDCAFSHRLRYDLSFGMGMSDTITLVFRTVNEIDYECLVEVVTVSEDIYIIVVIRFPSNVGSNCASNRDAFVVMKKNKCLHLCDLLEERDSLTPYYVFTVKGRIRFSFLSNSSINADINAHLYQVTATSARLRPKKGCNLKNETVCSMNDADFCFTSGVVCDGIKNCGVNDWFDERKSSCGLPVERLGYAPVIAVISAVICALIAAGHILLRCLPPLANSFFIFNANEDNRLCIDPVFKTPGQAAYDIEAAKRLSLIPVPSSSSENGSIDIIPPDTVHDMNIVNQVSVIEPNGAPKRKTTIKSMTEKIQEKLRLVTGRNKDPYPPQPSSSENNK